MVVLWNIDKLNLQIEFMKKTIFQGSITVLLFFGTWFALTQIDWIKIFKVEKVTDKTEQKLGDLLLGSFQKI
jgi:beta-barrel assembly-enhancing protease